MTENTNEAVDVTVIVPTYNTAKFLEQCLSTVLDNHECRLQVIAVNDGSTDGSLEIMRHFEASDARVEVIDKPNGGYGSGCNRRA